MGTRRASYDDSVGSSPRQPDRLITKIERDDPSVLMDKAELDSFLSASGNRPPNNDLYERINFLRTGRRTRNKPSSY